MYVTCPNLNPHPSWSQIITSFYPMISIEEAEQSREGMGGDGRGWEGEGKGSATSERPQTSCAMALSQAQHTLYGIPGGQLILQRKWLPASSPSPPGSGPSTGSTLPGHPPSSQPLAEAYQSPPLCVPYPSCLGLQML